MNISYSSSYKITQYCYAYPPKLSYNDVKMSITWVDRHAQNTYAYIGTKTYITEYFFSGWHTHYITYFSSYSASIASTNTLYNSLISLTFFSQNTTNYTTLVTTSATIYYTLIGKYRDQGLSSQTIAALTFFNTHRDSQISSSGSYIGSGLKGSFYKVTNGGYWMVHYNVYDYDSYSGWKSIKTNISESYTYNSSSSYKYALSYITASTSMSLYHLLTINC